MTLLIDGDIVAYEAAYKSQKTHDWDGDGSDPCVVVDMDEAKSIVNNFVKNLKDRLRASKVVMCLSDPKRRYWRHDLLPSYKQNRSNSVPPEGLKDLKVWMAEHPRAQFRDNLEADDVMGIIATRTRGCVICSVDKDLKQIPGRLYNWRTGIKTTVTREDGMRFHMYQTLCGDPVDNYRGCPGVGDVKATETAYSHPINELWAAVFDKFRLRGVSEEDALIQARVSRILQASDYDTSTKEVRLWQPTQQTLS